MLKEVLSIINEAHQTTHEILSGSSAHTLAPPLITEHQQEVGMIIYDVMTNTNMV